MTTTAKNRQKTGEPEPTWDIAYLFPGQGHWSEAEYLGLDTNRRVEFSDGFLEVLPVPTLSHQLLVAYLYELLKAFVSGPGLGLALFAGARVRLWRREIREPDIVFLFRESFDRLHEEFCDGADIVMEVVSGSRKDRRRDLKAKRADYARAKIPEYWIIDPEKQRVTVLRLAGKEYVVHGEFTKQGTASSHLLPGFTVDVAEALAKGRLPAKPGRKAKRRDANGKPKSVEKE